jgi:hypothetical protein
MFMKVRGKKQGAQKKFDAVLYKQADYSKRFRVYLMKR